MTLSLALTLLLGCPHLSAPTNPHRVAAESAPAPDANAEVLRAYTASVAAARESRPVEPEAVTQEPIWRSGEIEADPPPPFTAEALREGLRVGTRVAWRLTRADGSVADQRLVITAADAEQATLYTSSYRDGLVLGEPATTTATWDELVARSGFPAGRSTRQAAGVLLGDKRHDGWVYVVQEADGETVTEHAFVHHLPGAPVWQRQMRGEAEIYRLELLYHKPPER